MGDVGALDGVMDLLDAELKAVERLVQAGGDDGVRVGGAQFLKEMAGEFLGLGDGGPAVAVDPEDGLLDLTHGVENAAGKGEVA